MRRYNNQRQAIDGGTPCSPPIASKVKTAMNKTIYRDQSGENNLSHRFSEKVIVITAAFLFSQTIGWLPLSALAEAGDIRIAGQTVFTAIAGDGGSVSQRASGIQDNIDNALVIAQDRSPNSVNITYVQGLPVITLAGYLIARVTQDDAAAGKTTPALVADQWANAIRKALANQSSINAYVAQLNSSGASAAPVAAQSATNQYNNGPSPGNYDIYNSNGSSANFSGGHNYAQNSPQQQAPSGANSGYVQQGNGGGGYPQQGASNWIPAQNLGGAFEYQRNGITDYHHGRVAQAPAGQIISVSLATSIATQVAKPGDLLQANITQNINLGDSVIPAGSVVIGQVAEAEAGRRLTRSGQLQIKFNRIRTPDGTETPINAHIVGGIGKYAQVGGDQSDTYKGETMGNKVGSVAFRGLIGAGGGAALGTAVGAIAGQSGTGAGRGAWSGTAIGGGLGVADSLLLRKGKDITVPSGTTIQLQLDAPVSIAGVVPSGY